MTELELVAMFRRADHARAFSLSDQNPPHLPLEHVPLSVREHFDRDMPALFAEIERLRIRVKRAESR